MRYWLFLGTFLLAITLAFAQEDKLYDLDHLVDIRLEFEEDNWHDLLDSLKEGGKDKRLVAKVTVDGQVFPKAGIRYKGNSSYFNVRNSGGRKLPFNIKVNFVNKKERLPGGFVTLKLSNVFRDPSYLREVLSYEVARKYMPAPRANFAKVHVNGEYLGLYNLTESVDDDFLDRYYGEHKGTFFKCDPDWHERPPASCPRGNNASLEYLGADSVCYYSLYEQKSKHGWKDLIDLSQIVSQKPEQLSEVLDINETLWMLAFDNVLVNLDSYLGRLGHNYYLYLDKAGRWHPLLWDMNLCFGGFRYPINGSPLTNEGMQDMSLFLHYKTNNEQRPLVTNMLRDNHFRKLYLAHVRTIVEENFSNGWYRERATAIRSMIGTEVAAEPQRLYDMTAYEQNLNQSVKIDNSTIIGLTELMDARAQKILAHPLMQKTAPKVTTPQVAVAGEEVTFTVNTTDATDASIYYRSGTFQPWKRLPLTAGETGGWTGTLAAADAKHYFVVAENKYIATCLPRRAGMEYLEVVVE